MGSSDATDLQHATPPGGPAVSIATWNIHAGVDGWGRPFDVVGGCRELDADVLVLEESWNPEQGTSSAAAVGAALGYTVFEHALAHGRLAGPHPDADQHWMKSSGRRGSGQALYLDRVRPSPAGPGRRSRRYLDAEPGEWGVAVLSRLPARQVSLIDLGRLQNDPARRVAIAVRVDLGGTALTVVGTHMSHLTYGAPVQLVRLRRGIGRLAAPGPCVLAGDMNLWGPPLSIFFPGWRRAARGRTWPAWRPHSQVDHILLRGPLTVEEGRVFAFMGSDHRPVRARLRVPLDTGPLTTVM